MSERLTEAQEQAALAYDPFAGDRDVAPVTFADKMVVTGRTAHRCFNCEGPIEVGERHRYIKQACDGEIGSWRFCAVCCAAMASSWEDNGEAIDAQYSLGHDRRAALRDAPR